MDDAGLWESSATDMGEAGETDGSGMSSWQCNGMDDAGLPESSATDTGEAGETDGGGIKGGIVGNNGVSATERSDGLAEGGRAIS